MTGMPDNDTPRRFIRQLPNGNNVGVAKPRRPWRLRAVAGVAAVAFVASGCSTTGTLGEEPSTVSSSTAEAQDEPSDLSALADENLDRPNDDDSPIVTTDPSQVGSESKDELTVEDLKSAPVPGMCGHPWIELEDGRADFGEWVGGEGGGGGYPIDGSNWLGSAVFGEIVPGGSVGDAAAVISCNGGGAPWPDTVVIYRPGASGPEIAGYLGLNGITSSVAARVTSIRLVDGKVHLTWDNALYGRDMEYPVQVEFTAVLRHTGDGIELSNLEKTTLE